MYAFSTSKKKFDLGEQTHRIMIRSLEQGWSRSRVGPLDHTGGECKIDGLTNLCCGMTQEEKARRIDMNPPKLLPFIEKLKHHKI